MTRFFLIMMRSLLHNEHQNSPKQDFQFQWRTSISLICFVIISLIFDDMSDNQDQVAEYPSSDDEREKEESFLSNQRRSRQIEQFDHVNPHQKTEQVSFQHNPTEPTDAEEDRRSRQESGYYQQNGARTSYFRKQDHPHEHPETVSQVEPNIIELSPSEHSTNSQHISIPQDIPHQQFEQPILLTQSHTQPQQQQRVNQQSQNYQRLQAQSGERFQAQAPQDPQNHKVEAVKQTRKVEQSLANEPEQQDPRQVQQRYQVQTQATHANYYDSQQVKEPQEKPQESRHLQTYAQTVPIRNEQIAHENTQHNETSPQSQVQAQHIEPQHHTSIEKVPEEHLRQVQQNHAEVHHEQVDQIHQNQHVQHSATEITGPQKVQQVVHASQSHKQEQQIKKEPEAPAHQVQIQHPLKEKTKVEPVPERSYEEVAPFIQKPQYQEIEQKNEQNIEKKERQPLMPQNTSNFPSSTVPQKSNFDQVPQDRKRPLKGVDSQKKAGANEQPCKCQIM